MVTQPDMRVDLGKLVLKNPVLAASGTFGYGQEMADFCDPALLGGVVVKGLTLEPWPGNPPPRIVETSAGMLNSIGLENVGLDVFLKEKLPWLVERNVTVVANILGKTVDEYAALAQGLGKADGVAMIEINVSCPNVAAGGLAFGTSPEFTAQVVRVVVQAAEQPVMVKLTPMVSDITAVAEAAVQAGADIISLINTIPAMAVDLENRRPALKNVVGGLSGPAIKPVALRLVWEVTRAVDAPVIGGGGIMTAEDALEFLMVGARAVQVGTANFVDPRAALKILEGIEAYCKEKSIQDLSTWVGSLKID
ncbi:MAG: dihydroorotate dehydrogenase [Deltaproteobacteria bacterium]|nr:dihydroorotate dehydrogenase [Deltaproteobacteria bacterium]MBW2050662.1 dihydroorotate dehydrogenase [Deltaproteobacteria bacterium]MBW2139580.1 dihydroorotate dehydrogenase [Deltaproteobacteria bacterium]MBW2322936.1 dihydroorotate dehydrogenase [Deltaproteobacteria bacterium]